MAEIRIGAEQFRRQLTDLLNRVSYGDDHVVVERHGTALAALIPFEIYEALLAADIPQKLAKRAETEADTADLATEIEAILQGRGLTHQSSAALMQHEQLPVVREQAASYYVKPSTFTLEEVAMYLKLPVDAVAKGAAQGEIPGRRINNTWRFLKTAIDNWLRNVDGRQVLLQQAGAFADDDSLAELRRKIYQERGRPEAEEPNNEDAA
ncbi:MAG: type II toxin-antitoxin system prevent-host-death family antitoxin [Caldilineaceae bacterium]